MSSLYPSRLERFNVWLERAGRDTESTLTRARTSWKSLPLEKRSAVLKEEGFLCISCDRQSQIGATVCRKCEEEGKDKQDAQAKGEKPKDKSVDLSKKGHKPKGKKGKKVQQ